MAVIHQRHVSYPVLTPEEAVHDIHHNDTISFSGFGAAGSAKVLPKALAARARNYHKEGKDFKVRVLTGASSGLTIDEELAEADAINWRSPYQSAVPLRHQINRQEVEYVDMHLSHLPQIIAEGFLGKIHLAVVEATEITPDGRVYLTSSIGASPTFLNYAEKVIIEINHSHSQRLREMADIYIMPLPLSRNPIPILDPLTRIGWPYAAVDPKKVIGIVENHEHDRIDHFSAPDGVSEKISLHLIQFFLDEIKSGRLPHTLLPLQAGVGNLANGVLLGIGRHPDIPPFKMYSEVFQNAMVDLIAEGKLLGASATGLNITQDKLKQVMDDFDFFAPRIILRPQEISNHPGIIRRLGVIALNTALEMDIYGNVNSSHVYGMDIMNGIGGSGEFTRNSYLSIFMTASIAKGGKISAIVPMCPHIDNNEHSVNVVVTEQGLADLRGLGPLQRAHRIIENCAHPAYRDYLRKYVRDARMGHIKHDLTRCFEMHRNLMAYGKMLPDVTIE